MTKPTYKATIHCMIDGCNWKVYHENDDSGPPDWGKYAQMLRDHKLLRHDQFEIEDNFDEIEKWNRNA